MRLTCKVPVEIVRDEGRDVFWRPCGNGVGIILKEFFLETCVLKEKGDEFVIL